MSSTTLKTENGFELLCALGSAELSPERRERIANWNLSGLDWSEVLRLAEYHGVLPLVARNLIELCLESGRVENGRGLPPEVERSLRSAYEANARRSLWFTAELARIMQHFERRQLRALPYKGPVLAQAIYRDLGLRSFSDLDFLISPADFERAKQALAEIGYRSSGEFTPAIECPAAERLWLRTGYERSFDGAAGRNLVELQWAVLPHFYAVDLRVEDLLARAGKTVVGEREVPCLSPEDSVLVLCLHAAKHLWTRLIWVSDIAEALRSYSGTQTIDYSLVFSRARALGIARILGVSFWLVENVLRAEIPKSAEEMIAADPRVPALGSEFAARLARGATYDFESTEYFRLILKLRERRGDGLRYLWRLIWTPGAGEIAAVRLPEALFPLYRMVRISRLMRKLVW
jgi:putative nucleotidyltransferase-like protein